MIHGPDGVLARKLAEEDAGSGIICVIILTVPLMYVTLKVKPAKFNTAQY
ncbi:hypothetical protein ACJMK2_029784 [Sinanodonta woodiana]|uniref:Uncharacterized protein n=1 Tax=Sinanodonta woodiana TaxID=1069815 RepID=A0ABD3XF89_SINWO